MMDLKQFLEQTDIVRQIRMFEVGHIHYRYTYIWTVCVYAGTV